MLLNDDYKSIIINSLKYLRDNGKVHVYGYVIMPNHIHLIWELLDNNGKEKPHASFMKYTSHKFQKRIIGVNIEELDFYKVNSKSREYQFWQRNSLATHLYTPKNAYQKLDYIHNNPVQGKWMLTEDPTKYRFSSAAFYEGGVDEFGILSHMGDRL